ncbi:MAG: hypothetical protein ACYTG0_09905 [Planctomycetota bacterium]|jgi:hypothetical protein
MRRMAILALSVWVAVIGSIALFTLFWRIGYFRPHFLWGILSLAAMLIPMAWLAVAALWRCVRGPCRLRAVGWLLVGATPLVWTGAYLTELVIDAHIKARRSLNAPVRVAGVWVSTMFDIEARWRYPRWTRGRHAVLMDDGQTLSPEKLVAEMDNHIQAMADLLGQPVPSTEFPWVRGPLFGLDGQAVYHWALCGHEEDPGELTHLDRHEVAHALITALSGPDQYPPRLLIEGWAESQSSDRNKQIRNLAKDRKRGRAYSLQEFVRPDGYGGGGPAYLEGGPVVHYLIERYGAETFFRLYSGVRRDSFHKDCRAILGDSWETVEEDFWEWIEAEDELLAEGDVEESDAAPEVHVELAQSVDPADWQALSEGYREANKDPEPLPSNAAFVLEGEQAEGETESRGSTKPPKFEFCAIFEDQQFWIYDNNYYCGDDWFLMVTTERSADLVRNDSGSLDGRVRSGWAPYGAREKASELLAFYSWEANPADLLPLTKISSVGAAYHIERVVRPTDGKTGRWNVWFTRRRADEDTKVHYQVELDPAKRWWITRIVREIPGEWRSEADAEYEHVGDAFMPVTLQLRSERDEGTATVRWRVRPMSKVERQELKRRVEQAVRSAPPVPYQGLRRLLLAIVIACPVGGAAFLGITRRCGPPLSPQLTNGESPCARKDGESSAGEP